MDPFALYALTAGIVISAFGALIVVLPLVRFGFGLRSDESADGPLGELSPFARMAAAACFALTAGLTLVAVTLQARMTGAASLTELSAPLPELRDELERGGERPVQAHAALAALEQRLGEVERALETLRTQGAESVRAAVADDARLQELSPRK